MKNLEGHIITGLQKCENQDIIYKAYVVRDLGDEIEILDQEHLTEWLERGGNLEMFSVDKDEIISVDELFYSDLFEVMRQLADELA